MLIKSAYGWLLIVQQSAERQQITSYAKDF